MASAAATPSPGAKNRRPRLRWIVALLGLTVGGCHWLADYEKGGTPNPDAANDVTVDAGRLDAGDLDAGHLDAGRTDGLIGCDTSSVCPDPGVCASGNCRSFAWWDRSYRRRARLAVTHLGTAPLQAGAVVAAVVDTRALVDGGELSPSCDDLRVVHHPAQLEPGSELVRALVFPPGEDCSTSRATQVHFRLQVKLEADRHNGTHYLYFGNPDALAPTATLPAFDASSAAATLVCPFQGSLTCVDAVAPTLQQYSFLHHSTGWALAFDGIDDELSLPWNDPLLDAGTLEWRLLLDAPFAAGAAAPLGIVDTMGSTDPGAFAVKLDHLTGALTVQLQGSGGVTTLASSLTSWQADRWYHVALVWSGSSVALYVDGTQVALDRTGLQLLPQGSTLRFGRAGNRRLRGFLDEIRLSSRARYTASSVSVPAAPHQPDQFTELLLHLDEGGRDPRRAAGGNAVAIDASGRGRHAKVLGARYRQDLATASTGWRSARGQTHASHGGVVLERPAVNLVRNPSFEADPETSDWEADVGLGAAADDTTHLFGEKSLRLTTTSAPAQLITRITLGEAETFFFHVRADGSSVGEPQVRPIYDGIARHDGAVYDYLGQGWWRVSFQGGFQSSGILERIFGVELEAGVAINVDGVQLGGSGSYVDGDQGTFYRWDGDCNPTTEEVATAHAACSVRLGITDREEMLTYANIGRSDRLAASGGAVSIWVKPDFDPATTIRRSFIQCGNSVKGGFALIAHQSALKFYLFQGVEDVLSTTLDRGVWHHLVASWNGTEVTLYHNQSTSQSYPRQVPTLDDMIFIGSGDGWVGPPDAALADLRLFAGPLTDVDVMNLYQAGLLTAAVGPTQVLMP